MTKAAPKLRTALATTLALSMAIPPSFAQAAESAHASAMDADAASHDDVQAPSNQESDSEQDVLPTPDSDGYGSESVNESASQGQATHEGPQEDLPASPSGDVPSAAVSSGDAPASAEDHESDVRAFAEGDVVINEQSVPDPAFRAWMLNGSNLKGFGADGVLTQQEREQVSFISAKRQGIRSIKGIELFPNLRMMDFEGNYIQEVDLSGNPELLNVYLRNNLLNSIDFSHNTKLEFIEIFDNRLTEVDLSMLPNLAFVHLDYNRLKVIDLSHNTKLQDDGFVGNNNPLEKVILPKIEGRYFDTFVISELNEAKGYASTLPEWYTTPDFQQGTGFVPSTVAEREYQPFDGQTLYVKRTPNTYSIRFDANGGQGSMDSVARAWDDGPIPLPKSTMSRAGYRFAGWSLDRAAVDPTFADGQEVENLSGDKDTGMQVTLYAVWRPVEASSGYFRSQFDASLQAVYDDIVSQLNELADPFDPSCVQVQVPQGAESQLERLLFAVLRDHPEYFWIDSSKLVWAESGQGTFALDLKIQSEPYFVDGFTADNLASYRERFEAKVSQIVAAAPHDSVDAVRYFNAWLADNNVYNPNGLGASNFSRTAASAILSANNAATGPVCYGYATAMKVLLDRAGIDNAYIEGFARNGKNGSGEQHAWNAVKVNGSWYAVDPTWNDPASSSASALETYLLVGYDTVTTPALKGYERFGQNHDASRSPALRLGFSYPALEANAAPEVATGAVEVIGANGSARYDTLAKGIAAAQAGDTIKLWGDVQSRLSFAVTRDLTIDLNGHAVRVSHASAFVVGKGATLKVTNSEQRQATVSSEAASAIENNGTLVLDVRLKLQGSTASGAAVTGVPAQWAEHVYARSKADGTVIELFYVCTPANPQPGVVDISKVGSSVSDLIQYVNGVGAPLPDIRFSSSDGSMDSVPQEDIPAYTWKLVSPVDAEGGVAPLKPGAYAFTANVFGYTLSYEVTVTDELLDQIVKKGLDRAQGIVTALREQAQNGMVTSFDVDVAAGLVDRARQALSDVLSHDEASAIVDSLMDDLGKVPTVAVRADGLADAWRAEHRRALAYASRGAVSFKNAERCEADAASARADADDESLARSLPAEMEESDKKLVIASTQKAIGGQLQDLADVQAVAQWARQAARKLDGLPDPVTRNEVGLLQGLLDAFAGLSEKARSFMAVENIDMLTDLLEEARKDADDPNGGASGGVGPENPGAEEVNPPSAGGNGEPEDGSPEKDAAHKDQKDPSAEGDRGNKRNPYAKGGRTSRNQGDEAQRYADTGGADAAGRSSGTPDDAQGESGVQAALSSQNKRDVKATARGAAHSVQDEAEQQLPSVLVAGAVTAAIVAVMALGVLIARRGKASGADTSSQK